MRVIVGSKNPVKLASARTAFTTYFPNEKIEFIGRETDSGVSEQPMTVEETMTGAINRARNACDDTCDFTVGIEGGISFYKLHGQEYGVEISWVCVLDCKNGKNEVASSAGFPVFPRVLKHIRDGKSLSEAMADEYGLHNLGQRNGYIGWLSQDHLTRESSNYEAVLLALSSLLKEEQQH